MRAVFFFIYSIKRLLCFSVINKTIIYIGKKKKNKNRKKKKIENKIAGFLHFIYF
jgi:hypothetical protein